MKDYFLKEIENGNAFDVRDVMSIKEYVRPQVEFLREIMGDEYVNIMVEQFSHYSGTSELVFKTAITQSIIMVMPSIMIEVYKKLIDDFRKELKEVKV